MSSFLSLNRAFPLAAATLCLSLFSAQAVQIGDRKFGARELGLLPRPSGDLLGWDAPGVVPQLDGEKELVVQKLMPLDSRLVLGFTHAVVDGRVDSWGYNGVVNEYDNSQNYGGHHWQNLLYEYIKDPGIHITLPEGGFNYLYLRGGFVGEIYTGVDAVDGPGRGTRIARVETSSGPEGPDHFRFARLAFGEPVASNRVSFFRRERLLSDVAFFRIGAMAAPVEEEGGTVWFPGDAIPDAGSLGPDFQPLPTDDARTARPSNFHRRFETGDRTVRVLSPVAGARAIPLEARRQVHFLTPGFAGEEAIGAVRVDLILKGVPEGNLVNLTVQDPLIGNQELLRIDVRMDASHRVRCLLDFPDQIIGPGRRFWITIASEHGGSLEAGSRIALLQASPQKARAEYLAYRKGMLKGYFQILSEGRPWTQKSFTAQSLREGGNLSKWPAERVRPQLIDLFTTLENLHFLAPEDPVVSQYFQWLTREGKPLLDPADCEPVEPIPGVPPWAVLLDRCAAQLRNIPAWWIANRMTPDGELGGSLQDDTDMLGWWTVTAMLDSVNLGPKIRDIAQRQRALILKHKLKEGVNITVTDPLHAYEEGMNLLATMPLLFYGDPQAVEWLMESARTVEKWTYRTPENILKFKVEEFGWRTANEPPPTPPEKGNLNASLMFHPHLMLAWYNRNPHAIETLKAYADGFDHLIPGAYGAGANINFALYWTTGDAAYLRLPSKGGSKESNGQLWGRFQADLAEHAAEARNTPWWGGYQKAAALRWQNGDRAWAAGKDRETLVKALQYALYGNPISHAGGAKRYEYIWTQAEMFTDRVFLPAGVVGQVMLGGYTLRNKPWPSYAISYEGLEKDFAGLVLEQGRKRLKVALVNLSETPKTGKLRIWQLEHGRYEVTTGPDENDDGTPDRVEGTQTVELERGAKVPVSLPPRRVVIHEFRQLEKLDDLYDRADLALSAEDLSAAEGRLRVSVHNIGGRGAPATTLVVRDRHGNVLSTAAVPPLEAPLDLLPRRTSLSLRLPREAAEVVIDPAGDVPDITRENNRLLLP
ncbi:MAG TPA: hypothetical protein VNQ90_19500 [Chthoniobacteraceae bacterium]|nr:hypothetical protein [Chthoniobacteraceae bacterium]